jgi:predicted polyphosphate/ATP-dependent NAD kinase
VFRLGLVVNPLAGLGGAVGLKGSDGAETVAAARARGAEPRAPARAERCLAALADLAPGMTVRTWDGPMGAEVARTAGFAPEVLGAPAGPETSAADTVAAVRALADAGVDLLLFVGGDGTARDLVRALGDRPQPVLGIPAGVKMHSGVFAVHPEAAARIVRAMVQRDLVTLETAEVRDIDEASFRAGEVRTRHFGELEVPAAPRWVQATKIGGRESEPLVLEEIAAALAERIAAAPDDTWIIGPGSTTAALMAQLGLPNTLLGVDVIRDGQLIAADVTAARLLELVGDGPAQLVVTAIGGQGHVFGRGNQQLSPELLRRLGRERIHVVATRSKLAALEGRPLVVDTGDAALDREFAGHVPVVTGYEDRVLYPLGELDADGSSGEASDGTGEG